MVHIDSLKIGDQIEIYCTGLKVNAIIESIDKSGLTAKHKPVQWGNNIFVHTFALITDTRSAKPEKLRPHCFFNNLPIIG